MIKTLHITKFIELLQIFTIIYISKLQCQILRFTNAEENQHISLADQFIE